MTASAEFERSFACFGSTVRVHVGGPNGEGRPAEIAAVLAERQLLAVHRRLSRFLPDSELSRLNADPHPTVRASTILRRLADAAIFAGRRSSGLVDATLVTDLERAGYGRSRADEPCLSAGAAIAGAPERRAAQPGAGWWREIDVDEERGTIMRPTGVKLDSGGLGKGLAADYVASALASHACYAVDCGGDIRIGGAAGVPREVRVDDPFRDGFVARLEVADGGVATSGIGRRTWIDAGGRPAHHLLDPSTGRPAYTGVVQVTALAPTALEAEIWAKAALLAGPEDLATWLPYGGVAVLDDRSVEILSPALAIEAGVA